MILTLLPAVLLLSMPQVRAQRPASEPAPPPPGKLVDVGGWKLHLYCTGENQGNRPTVVFESGAGGLSLDWYFVQAGVGQFTRACSYDRAGTAWSELGPQPRTIRQAEYELHTLLARAGLRGPYILVGHSMGGLMVRNFQAQFPSDVAGLVLVDPASDDSRLVHFGKLIRLREDIAGTPTPPVRTTILPAEKEAPPEQRAQAAPMMRAVPPPPTQQALPPNQPAPQPRRPGPALPADIQRLRAWAVQQRERGPDGGGGRFTGQEFAELYAARQAHEHALGDLPLTVLIARQRELPMGIPQDWIVPNEEVNHQDEELARLSSSGKFIYAENSTHNIPADEPQVVIEAVRKVVEAVEQKSGAKPTGRK